MRPGSAGPLTAGARDDSLGRSGASPTPLNSMPLNASLRASLWLSLLASPIASPAQIYHWSAFAGQAPQWGSADGVGLEARFNLPISLTASTAGFVYVCDYTNHTIRRIAPNGAVTIMAGAAGQPGIADGTGTAARFNGPRGITLAGGFWYVVDSRNHTVRRLTLAGVVTTFAGRPGVPGAADGNWADARFDSPAAIHYDSSGNLFVADQGNHVIRKITPAGEVSTYAGLAGSPGSADGTGAAARFNSPAALWVNPDGVMYVTDTNNHTIRRITTSGVVTTIAGSPGAAGAVNGVGSAARFRYPGGILAYTNGTVLVADQNHAIRRIGADGAVTTYSGRLDVMGSRDGSLLDARYYLPTGLTFLVDGLAVVDSFNHAIRKIALPSGEVTTMAGSPGSFGRQDGRGAEARFNYPSGVAVHASGDVYLADSRGNTIRRLSPDGTVVRVAGALGGGDAYIDGPAEVQSLNYPVGVAVAPDRTVYFCEQQRHTIRVLRPDGSVATLAGREGVAGSTDGVGDAARFNIPSGLALDAEGNLYIGDYGNHTIRRIAAGTATVTTFAGRPQIAGSDDGVSGARFRFPRGVATDATGNVFVADYGNHTLRRISPTGEVSTVAGRAEASGVADGAGSEARFAFPTALAVDAQGILYIADGGNHTIRRCAGQTVSTIGGVALARGWRDGTATNTWFSTPSGIAIDPQGNLYVSEATNNLVRKGERLAPPAIATAPANTAAAAGGRAEFSVRATGGGLVYQWRLNGSPLPGATGATLIIARVDGESIGEYTVTVSNALGTATGGPARLTVAAASDTGRIVNLSLLTDIPQPGESFTMGFVIGGSGAVGAKPLVIRAAGPSLGALGVPNTLSDPALELFADSTRVGGNDNWGGAPALAAAMQAVGAFAFTDSTSRDAATAGDFALGNNSVKVSAAGPGTGAVIAEIYDATPAGAFTASTPRLINVSVLKHLGDGLTAGFAVGGRTARTVLIRAVGPTLGAAPFEIEGVVADPQLTLHAGGAQIGGNDNWGGTAALAAAFAQVGAFALPGSSRDAALLATLQPGTYTVQVSGVGGTTGLALVEIYEVP